MLVWVARLPALIRPSHAPTASASSGATRRRMQMRQFFVRARAITQCTFTSDQRCEKLLLKALLLQLNGWFSEARFGEVKGGETGALWKRTRIWREFVEFYCIHSVQNKLSWNSAFSRNIMLIKKQELINCLHCKYYIKMNIIELLSLIHIQYLLCKNMSCNDKVTDQNIWCTQSNELSKMWRF